MYWRSGRAGRRRPAPSQRDELSFSLSWRNDKDVPGPVHIDSAGHAAPDLFGDDGGLRPLEFSLNGGCIARAEVEARAIAPEAAKLGSSNQRHAYAPCIRAELDHALQQCRDRHVCEYAASAIGLVAVRQNDMRKRPYALLRIASADADPRSQVRRDQDVTRILRVLYLTNSNYDCFAQLASPVNRL